MATDKKLSKIHQRVLDKNRPSLDEVNAPPANTFWTDAQEHFQKCVEAISHVEGTLRTVLVGFVQDKEKLSLIEDQAGLANNINILTKDITEHFARLNSIYAKHNDRTGGTVTPDEHMELLQIHGEYAEALEIYQANIVPTIGYIMEQIGAAEKLILLKQQEEAIVNAATDVTVVTDVPFKEATESSL